MNYRKIFANELIEICSYLSSIKVEDVTRQIGHSLNDDR